MIEKLDSLLFLHTRRKRIGAAVAVAGAVVTTAVGLAAPAHAAPAPPPVVVASDSADFGQVSSGFGALLGVGGCIAAPSPISCGFAIKGNADYLQKYGDQPLHGNPDMTQDGPLPAL